MEVIIINTQLDVLVNDCYKVLKILYDNQVTIQNEKYCPLSQEEIAKELGVTRMTISNILKKLKENNLISIDDARKYTVKDNAIQIIEQINNIAKGV